MNCPFCNLTDKENVEAGHISCNQIICQSKNFLYIYNIKPVFPGHSLIITKKHVKSFLDLKNEDMVELFKMIKKIVKALKRAYNSDGFNVAIQEGESAGQSIEHFHIHIMPRKKGDMAGDPSRWFVEIQESAKLRIITAEEMKRNVDKIKKAIKC